MTTVTARRRVPATGWSGPDRARGLGFGLVSALLVVGAPALAHAGESSIFLGNEAALRAGAVNAMVLDGSAAWYNPAGLSKINHSNLDVSLNLYGLRIRDVPAGHIARFPDVDVTRDLDHKRVYIIPSSVVYSKRFRPGLVGAVSIFVIENESYSYRASMHDASHPISLEDPTLWGTTQIIDLHADRRTYMVGPSLGWVVSPRVRLGMSLHGLYRQTEFSYSFWSHSRELGGDAGSGGELLAQSRMRDRESQIGLQFAIGLQASPTDRLDIGLTLRSPQMTFLSWPGYSLTESYILTHPEGTEEFTTNVEETETTTKAAFDMVSNLRIDVGFSYRWDKVWWSADLNLRPRNPAAFASRRFRDTSFSLRTGFLIPVSEMVTLGTGFYVDQSGAAAGSFVDDIDFYGVTVGVRLERRLWRRIMAGPKGWKELAEGEDWKKKKKEDIYASKVALTTTIGLRYAFGYGLATGTVYTFGVDPEDVPAASLPSKTIPLTARAIETTSHDLTLFLGSQLTF